MRPLPLLLALLALATATACRRAQERREPTIPLTDCQLSGPSGHGRAQARCGVLQVPEDRSRPDGPKIGVRVAVIPARGTSDPSPVFFLAGGPGQAATEQHLGALAALSASRRERDVVLVDQRGTGVESTLRCELPEDAADPKAVVEDERNAVLDRCLKQLRGDPRFYTTEAFIQDLEAVREALGYSKIHLVGISYGTRAALAYLRAYPDRVLTAVLDGVAPPQIHLGELMERTAQRALDLDMKRCADTPACAARFPDLPGALRRVLDRLERQPERVNLRHPTTHAPTEVTLTRSRFATTTLLYSYQPELVGLLPLFIHGADTAGDFPPVAAQSLQLFDEFINGISTPLNYSVLCAEDIPFYAEKTPAADWLPATSYLGDNYSASLRQICARWPHATVSPTFKEPVRSSIPVLLLSGEADPVTPPQYAEEAKRTLSSSLHLEVKGHGHNVSFRGCLPQLIAELQRTSSVTNLDTACVKEIAPVSMFLDFLGHEP